MLWSSSTTRMDVFPMCRSWYHPPRRAMKTAGGAPVPVLRYCRRSCMSATAEAPRPKRILVVDDERDLRTFVAEIFDNLGYVVECAEDGAEALAKMESSSPDLVVLDLMMPVIDGWGVLDRLR